MTDVEYCVHVSNKYVLSLDDATDPSDLISQLTNAVSSKLQPSLAATKKDESKTVTKKDTATIKKAVDAPVITKTRTDENKMPLGRDGVSALKKPTNQRKDVDEHRNGSSANDRGARRGGRRGRGGFDPEHGGESRRLRGNALNLPPRMGGYRDGDENAYDQSGFANNNRSSGVGDDSDKFGDRFGEGSGGATRGGERRGRGGATRRPRRTGFGRGGGFGAPRVNGETGGFGGHQESGGFHDSSLNTGFSSGGFGSTGLDSGLGSGFGSVANNQDFVATTEGFGNSGFESRSSERGGRGRGRGGRGRGRGFGGRGRAFDRQSGSDRTGIKSVDKRDGGGSHNWGHTGEIADDGDNRQENTTAEQHENSDEEKIASGEEKVAENDENQTIEKQVTELTYDEWKASQVARLKPAFNVRRPGEGENDKKEWKGLVPLARPKVEQGKDGEAEEEDKRPKHQTLPIQINFIDEAARGGFSTGIRGPAGSTRGRGSGGRGRGGGFSVRGNDFREGGFSQDSGFGRGGRSRGRGVGFGASYGGQERKSGGQKPAPYKMDEETFPSLAGGN